MYQTVSLVSLVFSGPVDHSFAADLDTDSDSASGSFDLVEEQEMAFDREALEVQVVDEIP